MKTPAEAETLTDAFAARFAATPERPFIEFGDAVLTYGEFGERVERLATGLAGLGVEKGDRVGICMPNGPDLIAAHLAVGRLGAVRVPANPAYRAAEAEHLFSDAGARVVFAGAEQRRVLADLRERLPALATVVVPDAPGEGEAALRELEASAADRPPLPHLSPDDPAMICYTSGTTGRSKGAVLSHRNLLSNIRTLVALWEWTAEDVLCLALPLFHLHGLGLALHGTLLTGCRTVLRERFNAAEVMAVLADRPCTLFMGVPTMYERFLALPPEEQRDLAGLRLCISGSAPLPPDLFRRLKERHGLEILERYGLSETVMNASNPYRGERRPGSVGPALPGVELRVCGPEGETLPRGETGEVCVRGPNVFPGYLNRPEADAEAFREGWFRTGDLGRLDDDGYLYIAGRSKDLIISGGYNIYPTEVEEVLRSHPAVAEAAVVGAPDAEYGEAVLAVVVKKPDAATGAEELITYCRERLAPYKKPRRVEFVAELPLNAMGKVLKNVLRERYG